jgi:dinuclear metal center YbgI/SA1388 family protein
MRFASPAARNAYLIGRDPDVPAAGTLRAVPSLADVIAVFDELYDPAWAEDWDAVGLVCGDPAAEIRKVLFAVDPVEVVVDEAIAWEADLVVTHHPLFLRPVHGVPATTPKGRVVHRLISHGIALHVVHTNADSADPGVSDAMARCLDLDPLLPLAAREQHESLGIGRICELAESEPLAQFVHRIRRGLPMTPAGIRVAGDPHRLVRTVAVCGGAGDSLLDAARVAGADVFVTADLRHHPAGEAIERGGPALIDVAHWASEWPWLADAAERLTGALAARGATVETHVSRTVTDPWTAHATYLEETR